MKIRQGLNSFRKALESGFRITAESHVILSGADAETAKGVVRGGGMICLFGNATRNNIEVKLAVESSRPASELAK